MNPTLPFIQALSQTFGQTLSTSDETQTYTLRVDGEEIYLRYIPEDDLWLYFGFVTDFMRPTTPEQLEKALELNLFGRGTAGLHLGLIGQAIALSGSLPLSESDPDRLIEALAQLAQHLSPLLREIEASNEEPSPQISEEIRETGETVPVETLSAEDDPFSFLNNSLIQV